jgi:DNA-binding PadR family transcriptional regulator
VIPMSETVENLILDLLEWIGRKQRTYPETIEAWRTSCPRLPVWEDANDRGLVETAPVNGRSVVRLTASGRTLLKEQRPQADAPSNRTTFDMPSTTE